MELTLCSPRVPSVFGGRAGSEVSTGHVFPEGVFVGITLMGNGVGDGGAKTRSTCDLELLLYSMVITALLREGSGPK